MPVSEVVVEKSFWEKNKIILVLLLVATIIAAIVIIKNNTSTSVGPPTNNSSTNMTPMRQMPMDQMPVSQMPVSQMPVSQMPVRQIPVSQMPVRQMPMDQMPMDQMKLPPLEDIPTSIKNIITEIGQNQATPEQLKRLEKAVLDTIEESKTTALKIVNDVINAPKDKFGLPLLEKRISSLYILMFMLFIGSDGKYFKNEVGPVMEASLRIMSKK